MHVKSAEFIILIFYSLGLSVVSFHMPNLDVDSNIDVDNSQTNTGLIHSSIHSNWSQCLSFHHSYDYYSICSTVYALEDYREVEHSLQECRVLPAGYPPTCSQQAKTPAQLQT